MKNTSCRKIPVWAAPSQGQVSAPIGHEILLGQKDSGFGRWEKGIVVHFESWNNAKKVGLVANAGLAWPANVAVGNKRDCGAYRCRPIICQILTLLRPSPCRTRRWWPATTAWTTRSP